MSNYTAGAEAGGSTPGERGRGNSPTITTSDSLDSVGGDNEANSVETAAHAKPGTEAHELAARALVITCSDSVSQGRAKDRSGPLVVQSLTELGFRVDSTVLPDERDQIAVGMRSAVADGVRVVVATGGTGLGPRDVTPEALTAVCEREIPGFGEAFRAASRDRVPLTDLSRAAAGTLGDAVILALPGSVGGARDGMAVIGPLIQHALDMMSGQGHSHGDRSGRVQPTGPGHDHSNERGQDNRRESDQEQTWTQMSEPPRGENGPDGPSHLSEHARDQARVHVADPGRVMMATVTDEPIDPRQLSESVTDSTAGAVVEFAGRVRDHDDGRDVTELKYEAHPDAQDALADVLAEACRLPGVVKVAAAHRAGSLQIGDLAFAVAVSAPHRSEAFAAASWLVDEIKDRLPVWKLQTFADGDKEWVNCA